MVLHLWQNKLPQDAAQAVSFPSPKGPEQQYVSANTRMQEARRKLAPFVDTHTGAITQALAQRLPQAAQASVRHNHALAGVLGAVGSGGRPGPSGTGISQTCAAAQALLQERPDLEDGLLLHAVATGSLHSSDQGIKVVKTWLQDHPSAEATRAALMGAHIASSAQPPKLETALSFLTHPRLADNVKHAPAVLATRALLRERLARPQAAQQSGQELQAAIGWWTDQAASSKRTEALVACNEQQAVLLMRTGDSQGALQSLKTLKVRVMPLRQDGLPDAFLHNVSCITGADPSCVCRCWQYAGAHCQMLTIACNERPIKHPPSAMCQLSSCLDDLHCDQLACRHEQPPV